jgi:hypothetical protein
MQRGHINDLDRDVSFCCVQTSSLLCKSHAY